MEGSIRRNWSLVDRKDDLIEQWAREFLHYEPLKRFNLTAPQRRVIASLKWEREVARSNAHMPGWRQQPQPIMGFDESDRIVVQFIDNYGSRRVWALTREGEPADIKGKVISLKTGMTVRTADGTMIPPKI